MCFSETIRTSVQKDPNREDAEAGPWRHHGFQYRFYFTAYWWPSESFPWITSLGLPTNHQSTMSHRHLVAQPGNEATYLAWPQDAVEMKFKSALCLQRPLQNPLCSQIPGRRPLRDYAVCLGAVVVCLFSLRLVFLFTTSKFNFILMHWSIK